MNANSTSQRFSWDVEMASENYFAHLTDCQTERSEEGGNSEGGSGQGGENEKEVELRQREGCGKCEQTAIQAEMACVLMLYFLWHCLTFHPGLLT